MKLTDGMNQKVVDSLQESLNTNSVKNIILFIGEHGSGKTSTARALGQGLLSHSIQEVKMKEFLESNVPVKNISEFDMSQLSKIVSIDAIISSARKLPFGNSKCKIVILQDIGLLAIESQNELLSLCEENLPYLYLFLVTTTPEHIIPALSSRCTKYLLNRTVV